MKQSTKVALGGMIAALSLALLISVSMVPFITYALPAAAGALLCLLVIELNKKWAFGVYCAVAILAVLLVGEKEVAFLYCALFGYYPILKALLEKKLPSWAAYPLKLALFNAAIVASYYVMMHFFGMEVEDLERFGKWSVPVLLAVGSVTFLLYDHVLTQFITLYMRKGHKRLHRIFR